MKLEGESGKLKNYFTSVLVPSSWLSYLFGLVLKSN